MRRTAIIGLVMLSVTAPSSIGGAPDQNMPAARTSPIVRFVGLAHEPPLPLGGVLSMSRFCNKELPETRACELDEILRAIPPPDVGHVARVFRLTDAGPVAGCVQFDGSFVSVCPFELPVACCGF
jgi:hypothetical protein